MSEIKFPTEMHKQTVERIENYFIDQKDIDTILLVNSLARGKANDKSDIDMAILVTPDTGHHKISQLKNSWQTFLETDHKLNQYRNSNKFAQIHLDIIDGVFEAEVWEDGVDVDNFEVEIGNRLAYSAPLTKQGEYFEVLKTQWLPYYKATLQVERVNLATKACLYEIEHIPIFVQRELYFQAYDRLNVAFRKFLQALFIKRKIYPIAYNKWIKEQIVEILNMPELYQKLVAIFSINNFESDEICKKAETLKTLLHENVSPEI